MWKKRSIDSTLQMQGSFPMIEGGMSVNLTVFLGVVAFFKSVAYNQTIETQFPSLFLTDSTGG
ncbi:hypothetical protein NCCP133_17080 [Cytobacillus sp. NCCP-133]|nr:hypothetical protein NCCP133_17080 [Cytobacillus sp. NCCP-133]